MFKKCSRGWGQLLGVRFPLFECFIRWKGWRTGTEGEKGQVREKVGERRELYSFLMQNELLSFDAEYHLDTYGI